MREFTADWFSRNIQPLKDHVLLNLPKNPRWLELGSFEGRSACWIIDNIPEVDLTCVDSWHEDHHNGNGIYVESRFDKNVGQYVSKHKVASLDFLVSSLANKDTELWDVIYIDGDHEAKSVLEDFVLAWKLLKLNGIIIFDDYKFTFDWCEEQKHKLGPGVAIDSCLKIYESRSKVLYSGDIIIIQKTGSCPSWCGGFKSD